ncbi:uroplakin-3b [Ambystoma mexicanum]|uniref:uroplakin-3b n=1 Tax=Ambystoma mexicanum TaxID=8296 RepID=UPI0037E70C88
MTLPLLSVLLAGIAAVHGLAPEFYVPQVTTQQILGKVTSTTFALEMPSCIFDTSSPDTIWLLVSYASASVTVNDERISRYSQLSTFGYYMTLAMTGNQFRCPPEDGKVAVLRVGTNTSCVDDPTIQDCNGPLPPSSSVRVRFVRRDVNNNTTARTRWSDVINLKKMKPSSGIDTWPGRRSGGMIVITTILSVFLAILLACLMAAFAFGCKDICWRKEINNTEYVEPDFNKLKRYNSHHVPETVQQHL